MRQQKLVGQIGRDGDNSALDKLSNSHVKILVDLCIRIRFGGETMHVDGADSWS